MPSGSVSTAIDFNPRSREGSDPLGPQLKNIEQISIHAPAKGATTVLVPVSPQVLISIHAPAKGATRHFLPPSHTSLHFNPRSREGSDENW